LTPFDPTVPFFERKPPYVTSELAELLKPFIFLDAFNEPEPVMLPLHPHSGIATLTYVTGGTMPIEDSTGLNSVMQQGDIEWLRSGGGAWHGGGPGDHGAQGFQLWLALPPEWELDEAKSLHLLKENVPKVGPAAVLLGTYRGVSSPLTAPSDITYLGVSLKAGQRWRYEPPAAHTVAWMATRLGSVRVPELVEELELVAFEPSNRAIEFEAVSDAEFVIGSGVKHPYPLSIGRSSVHTSPEALQKGEARIAEIKVRLTEEGRLAPAE
jgi:redox-sensitive bicupin YhaK (pirin superfamily)